MQHAIDCRLHADILVIHTSLSGPPSNLLTHFRNCQLVQQAESKFIKMSGLWSLMAILLLPLDVVIFLADDAVRGYFFDKNIMSFRPFSGNNQIFHRFSVVVSRLGKSGS